MKTNRAVKFHEMLGKLIEAKGLRRNRKKICLEVGVTTSALTQHWASACAHPYLSSEHSRPKSDWRHSPPVNKEQMLNLIERVRLAAGVELSVIVGSQWLYAVTSQAPDSIRRSLVCDFLLIAAVPPIFRAVI